MADAPIENHADLLTRLSAIGAQIVALKARERDLRALLASSSRQVEELTEECRHLAQSRLTERRAAAELVQETVHRADQAERQVQTLRHMWDTVHAGLGLAPEVSLAPDMVVARVREAEQAIEDVRVAMKAAPMERLDTHGWIECVWCHATREKHSEPATMIHEPTCGALVLRALLAPAPPAPDGTA